MRSATLADFKPGNTLVDITNCSWVLLKKTSPSVWKARTKYGIKIKRKAIYEKELIFVEV